MCIELSANTAHGIDRAYITNAARRKPGTEGTVLLQLNEGFFPNMELVFRINLTLRAICLPPVPTLRGSLFAIDDQQPDQTSIVTKLYADSAQEQRQEFKLFDFDDEGKLDSPAVWLFSVPSFRRTSPTTR